ncbi:MAG: mucoidy inhibitor MuiA family protein, partial [Massilia sp.]
MVFKQAWPFGLALAASSALATEAPIQSVTLYPGSATVERVAQVAPGATQVEITGLPANFDKDTVRLQADAGIQVGQVVTRDQARADSPSAREADLEAKVQALQDQVAAIDADIKSAQIVQGYLEKLGTGGDKAAPVDAKNLAGTLDAIRKGAFDALERIRNDETKKRALAKQLDAAGRDLAQARGGTRAGRTITVQVAARQGGKIVLTYQVDRAGWKPAYRAALDANASTIDLERMATISQKTGEDWSNVKLRLSTGQPGLVVQAPDPSPWLLDYQPPVEKVMAFARAPFAAPAPPPPPAPNER